MTCTAKVAAFKFVWYLVAAFAINVDASGLQSFNGSLRAFDLNTLSDWAFHSIPAANPGTTCAQDVNEGSSAVISCAPSTIVNVTFASFGTPAGSCGGGFTDGTCNALNSTAVVAAACLGRQSCSVFSSTVTFGDPCLGTRKHLDVNVTCSGPVVPPPRAANEALMQVRDRQIWIDLVRH